ncbi:MAG: hypothetical protein AAF676_12765 [Pseudomonadota bacterium]
MVERMDTTPRRLAASALLGGLLSAAVFATPVEAQVPGGPTVCGQRDKLVQRLEVEFGETRQGFGLQRGSSIVEVFASSESGSWTILVTRPTGVACMVAAGQNWAATPDEAKKVAGEPV